MKISAVYSNDDSVFPRIDFFKGLCVVFATVKTPDDIRKDNHNLGKSLLVKVIDFVMLGGLSTEHPFKKHPELFDKFVFFGEFVCNSGIVVTVRRPVTGRQAICIQTADERNLDYSELAQEDWEHPNLSMQSAIALLNEVFALDSIAPLTYRKALGYFLRTQDDYSDEFQIAKFRGKDVDWKPATARLLGFDDSLIRQKYEVEYRIVELKKQLSSSSQNNQYDEIRGLWQAKKSDTDKLRDQVNSFSFQRIESEISRTDLGEIEAIIAALNREQYEIGIELAEIERSLRPDFKFDIDKVRSIYEEAGIYFSQQLTADYAQLVEFNRQVSQGRRERLSQLAISLNERRAGIELEMTDLDARRQHSIAILKNKDTLEKYRQLNSLLLKEEEEVRRLRSLLDTLDAAEVLSREITKLERDKTELVEAIRDMYRMPNHIYEDIRESFIEATREIIGVPAIIAVDINKSGNLTFKTKIIQSHESGEETSLSDGTSYKKLLCACLDLALLIAHSSTSFYRFVYHDGIFEGLDNRRKVSLLNFVRHVCETYGIQYILTVIDTDLPRNTGDDKVLFSHAEIIRELDDSGERGRLFRMSQF